MNKKLEPIDLQAIRRIKEAVGDASLGLPEAVFELVSAMTPMVNVDLLLQDSEGRILMIWREDEYCGRGWHIPGGIVRFQEAKEERLLKTAEKELGVSVTFEKEPVAIKEIILPQTVRGHFISFLYRCFLPETFPILQEAREGEFYLPGDMRWHQCSPKQWVKGQKKAYEELFRADQSQRLSFEETERTERGEPNFFLRHDLLEKLKEMKAGACTFVFDIDGVVAQFEPSLRYDRAKPDQKTIDVINRLYDYGNRIVLFTARGSESGIDWSAVTERQMEEWGVRYHQLRFGKPAATFYVDDKNMSLEELFAMGELL